MILLITGDHPRHKYLANYLAENVELVGWIIEKREPFKFNNKFINYPNIEIKDLLEIHFKGRFESEMKFFGKNNFFDAKAIVKNLDFPSLECNYESLNSLETVNFIKKINPQIVLTYGCHVLKKEILDVMPFKSFNLHGGISPWYRGCITHFWPSYNLEPQMTGMTMHKLTSKLDGGDILHQNSGVLMKGDGIHDLSCRTLDSFFQELPAVINKLLKDEFILKPQISNGKLWLENDWNPQHLRVIYKFYKNKIVDYCLDNCDTSVKKKIIRCI